MKPKLYVADYYYDAIFIYNLDGTFYNGFGGYGSEDGMFWMPHDVKVYKNELYVADYRNLRIQVFDMEGNFKRKWFTTRPGAYRNWGVNAISISNDEIFAGVYGDPDEWKNIAVFDLNGVFKRFWGPPWEYWEDVVFVLGIAATPNFVFISDYNHDHIYKYDRYGKLIKKWGSTGTDDGQFDAPRQISVSGSELYVTEYGNHRVQVFDLNGNFLRKWGEYGNGPGYLNFPIDAWKMGNTVYVSSGIDLKVQAFDPNGVFKSVYNDYLMNPYGICVPGGKIDYLPILGMG